MDFQIGLVIAGLVVGFVVGLTGVGGGSLMTPILLYFGIPPTKRPFLRTFLTSIFEGVVFSASVRFGVCRTELHCLSCPSCKPGESLRICTSQCRLPSPLSAFPRPPTRPQVSSTSSSAQQLHSLSLPINPSQHCFSSAKTAGQASIRFTHTRPSTAHAPSYPSTLACTTR